MQMMRHFPADTTDNDNSAQPVVAFPICSGHGRSRNPPPYTLAASMIVKSFQWLKLLRIVRRLPACAQVSEPIMA
jgi:hypothetical protein